MDNNAKLELFKQAILESSQAESRTMITDIRSKRAAAGRTKEEIAAKETMNSIKTETARSEAAFRKEMSKYDYEQKKTVLMYRNDLIDSFFSDIEKKLREFAASDDYDGYLKRSLEKIRATIALDSATIIYARPCDIDKVRSMTSCEVTADSSIILGGLRAVCRVKNVLCDVTLDIALEDEKRGFNEKTELRL